MPGESSRAYQSSSEADTGEALTSSEARRPSRRRSTRSAILAMAALCVTITRVQPYRGSHALHELEDLLGGLVVERARGLVAQDEVRIIDEGATDGAALLLATGDLARELVAMFPEAERAQKVLHGQGFLERCAVTSMFSLIVRSGTRL